MDKELRYDGLEIEFILQEIEEKKTRRSNLIEKKDLLIRDGNRMKEQHTLQKKQLAQRMADSERKISEAIDGSVREQYQRLLSLQQKLEADLTKFAALSEEKYDGLVALQEDELSLQKYVIGEKRQSGAE